MPQSILILVSSVLFGLLGYTRHQQQAQDDRATMVRAIEASALVVAEEWTGNVRDLAFDEADVGADEVRVRRETSDLSTSLGPDSGETSSDVRTFDDVDDFHGFSQRVTVPIGRGVNTMDFDVTARASYARISDWEEIGARSTGKIVVVTVTEATSVERGRPAVQVTIPVRVTPAHQFAHR